MNYKLEFNKQGVGPNIIFHNIIFDFFKVNIVERYSKSINSNQSPDFVIFKVRTLNDEIINTKKGNGRVKLKGDTLLTYLLTYLQRNNKSVKFLRIPKQNHQ